jgi:hypothetical protein
MCTTSVECKTVLTAVLMVKSDMDPHMLVGILVGLVLVRLLGVPVGVGIS